MSYLCSKLKLQLNLIIGNLCKLKNCMLFDINSSELFERANLASETLCYQINNLIGLKNFLKPSKLDELKKQEGWQSVIEIRKEVYKIVKANLTDI